MIQFVGAGSDNNTYDVQIWGWQMLGSDSTPTEWVPTLLSYVTCTLSSMTGVSGQSISNTDRIADTIALATGFNANVSNEVVSPANNTGAHMMVDVRGFRKVQIEFKMVSATNGNCIYRAL
jgi:hypothetical protein